jgi:hypothetical protein
MLKDSAKPEKGCRSTVKGDKIEIQSRRLKVDRGMRQIINATTVSLAIFLISKCVNVLHLSF